MDKPWKIFSVSQVIRALEEFKSNLIKFNVLEAIAVANEKGDYKIGNHAIKTEDKKVL